MKERKEHTIRVTKTEKEIIEIIREANLQAINKNELIKVIRDGCLARRPDMIMASQQPDFSDSIKYHFEQMANDLHILAVVCQKELY